MLTSWRSTASFDNTVAERSQWARPSKHSSLKELGSLDSYLPRGNGLSYGCPSFRAGSVSVSSEKFDRILEWDERSGELLVESGLTLGEVLDFLLSKGRILPVVPGHRDVTVGGAVAFDVHGKNHHRVGTFSRWVSELVFVDDLGEEHHCSPGKRGKLFEQTCGGMGLTGFILRARLKTQALQANRVRRKGHPVSGLLECSQTLEQLSQEHDHLYSWHDCTRPGRSGFGRGVVWSLDPVDLEDVPAPASSIDRPSPSPRKKRTGPCLFRPWTVGLLNRILHARDRVAGTQTLSWQEALYPIQSELYYQFYGTQGLREYQFICPSPEWEAVSLRLEEILLKTGALPVVSSMKYFKGGNSSGYRFDGEGMVLALDLPADAKTTAFTELMDEVVAEAGGRLYLAKESRPRIDAFDRLFPQSKEILQSIQQASLSKRIPAPAHE